MKSSVFPQNTAFKNHVEEGLSAKSKFISSRYFYDKKGDAIFQQIMAMPEYYLTNSEMEIFSEQAEDIISVFKMQKDQPFELIELGAGDGTKTIKLLTELENQNYNFEYLPVDISDNALDQLKDFLSTELPNLRINPKQGEYFKVLEELLISSKPKIILFIGSNLGNMDDEVANKFMQSLASYLKKQDKILLGLDLIKSVDIVLPAYNDPTGITRDFNLNLLTRINRELGGDFDIQQFSHQAEYSEETGITKSFIKSNISQKVTINAINKTFDFKKDELIHTEISRKYNDPILNMVLTGTNLSIIHKFTDKKGYFTDFLLEVV